LTHTPILLILAGGASSRMWPLREKSLLRFGSEPLLINQLQRYHALGCNDVIIVGNPDNREDIAALTARLGTLNIQIAVQEQPKGMGDAILQAAPLLENRLDSAVYITQVHDVVDDSLHQAMLTAHRAAPDVTFLAGYEMDDYFPGGYMVVDGGGRISGIIEKPAARYKTIGGYFLRDCQQTSRTQYFD